MVKQISPLWSIRRANSDDQDRILDLQRQLNRPARTDSIPSEYFVAVSGRQIIGGAAVRVRRKVGYLYGLAVAKAWRKQGIGHALTEVRLEWLRSQAVQSAYVMAMFWNVKFLRKHDFNLKKRSAVGAMEWLHGDFADGWSAKSALLCIDDIHSANRASEAVRD
jgi:N-acetylglutamate synthase-like GNAT family acetyltransferase